MSRSFLVPLLLPGLDLYGAPPTGGQFRWVNNGVAAFQSYLFGNSPGPYALVIQGTGTTGGDIGLQSGTNTNAVTIDGNGKRCARFQDGVLWIGDEVVNTNNNASPLRLYGGATQDYISFYHGASLATRSGLIGMTTADNLQMRADGTTLANATIQFAIGNGVKVMMHPNGDLQAGNTGDALSETGATLVGRLGQVWGCNDLLNTPSLLLNKFGAGNAAGSDQVHFRLANVTKGSISHPSTATTAYNTSSDYRLKDVLGTVETPLERLGLLRPCHVRWKENGEEQDTFIAHEVAEVVPVAVTGVKDAVAEADNAAEGITAGDIVPQQLDASKLIPLLVAAVQEQAAIIDSLTTRIAALEAA